VPPTGFTNLFANPVLNVNNNTPLRNVNNGISVSNYAGITPHLVSVQDNTVTIPYTRPLSSCTQIVKTGISINNSFHIFCKSNTVTGPTLFALQTDNGGNQYNVNQVFKSTNPCNFMNPVIANFQFSQNTGLLNQSNSGDQITCNTSLGGCLGFEFNQTNAGTQWMPLNSITNQHYYGLLLNNSCQLPFQFNNTTASQNVDNRFNFTPGAGLLFQTFVTSGSPKPTQFINGMRVRQSGVFLPTSNDANPSFNKYATGNGNGLLAPIGTVVSAVCPSTASLITNPTVHDGSILGTYTVSSAFTEQNYISKQNIYNMLKLPEANTAASPTVQSFFATADALTHPYRKMWDMVAAISQGNYITAANLANDFAPVNDIELNYKRYVLLNSKFFGTQTATSTDMQELLNLAMACPHTKGNIVYYARAMHNALNPDNVIVFVDNCDGSGLYKTTPSKKSMHNVPFDATLYPSPTDNTVYIKTTLNIDELLVIEVFDITGKTIISQNCMTTSNNCFVNLLPNALGIYFVKITNTKNETIIKKIVLQ
jgi:Secretion system C-terminal sorting domain